MADTLNKLEQDSLAVASETGYRKNTSFRIGNLFYRILQFFKNLFGGTYLLGEKENVAAIKAIANPTKGDTWRALDTDHYWTYDGKEWNDIGVVLPSDAVTKFQLSEKGTANNPFVPAITGTEAMPIEQWRNFILGLELTINYDPELFYSPAIIQVTEKNVEVHVYSSPSEIGASWNKVSEFIIPKEDGGIKYLKNTFGTIVVNLDFAPIERIEAQNYKRAGFSPIVFKTGNSQIINIERNKQETDTVTFDLMRYLIGTRIPNLATEWEPTKGYWNHRGEFVASDGYNISKPIAVESGSYYAAFTFLTNVISIVAVDENNNYASMLKTGKVGWFSNFSNGLVLLKIPDGVKFVSIPRQYGDASVFFKKIAASMSIDLVNLMDSYEKLDAEVVDLLTQTADNARELRIQKQFFIGNRNLNLISGWLAKKGYWQHTGAFIEQNTWESSKPIPVVQGHCYMILSVMHSNIGVVSVDSEGNYKKVLKRGQMSWQSGYSYGLTMVYIPWNEDITHISVSTETSNKAYAFVQDVNSNLFIEICRGLLDVETIKSNYTPLYEAILPPVMYATVGKEFNLYYDTFILCPEYGEGHPPFMFDIDCTKGLMDRRSFRFTPSKSDVGEYPFTLKIMAGNGTSINHASKIKVVDAICPSRQTRILSIGDSTTDDTGDVTKQLQINLAECTGTTPFFVGTHQDAPYHNEGRTGKTYYHFASGDKAYKFHFKDVDPNLDVNNVMKFRGYYYDNDKNQIMLIHRWVVNPDGTGYAVGYHWSAFTPPTTFPATLTPTNGSNPTLTITSCEELSNYSVLKDNEGTGLLNFSYYRTEVLKLAESEKIDILTMDCAINDLSGSLFTNSQISSVVNNAKRIADAFIADNPNGKVVFCIPKSRNSDLRLTSRDMLRYNIFNFTKRAIEIFKDNENVIISQSGFGMDRYFGYPLVEQKVAERYTETYRVANNDVHQKNEGSQQIADTMEGAVLIALNS